MGYGHARFKIGIIAIEYALDLYARVPISNCKLHFSVWQCALQSRKANCVHDKPLALKP
jgi:hypothetical protein